MKPPSVIYRPLILKLILTLKNVKCGCHVYYMWFRCQMWTYWDTNSKCPYASGMVASIWEPEVHAPVHVTVIDLRWNQTLYQFVINTRSISRCCVLWFYYYFNCIRKMSVIVRRISDVFMWNWFVTLYCLLAPVIKSTYQ